MTVNTQWMCPTCDTKNFSEHPITKMNEETFYVVGCKECGNPIAIGVSLVIAVVGYELHEMKLDFIKIASIEEENYERTTSR